MIGEFITGRKLKDATKDLGQVWQVHEASKEGQNDKPEEAVNNSA